MKGQRAAQLVEVETLHRVLSADVVTDYSLAIDAGANVGTWSVVLAGCFTKVIAFEPNHVTHAVLVENTAEFGNVDARCQAVMDRRARITGFHPDKSKKLAGYQIGYDPHGAEKSTSIDALGLESCGLIKLDLEGAEMLALRGAAETIDRCQPVLIVEIGGLSTRFGHTEKAVHRHILGLGYRELFRSGVDRVFIHE